MRFALLFLLCFVSLSCSQNYQQRPAVLPFYSSPFFYYWPTVVNDDTVAENPPEFQQDDRMPTVGAESESQSRASTRFWNDATSPAVLPYARPLQGSFWDSVIVNPFLTRPYPTSKPLFENPFANIMYRSTVVTMTSTSTVITASVTSCIPSSLFARDALNVTCNRKRREAVQVIDLFGHNDGGVTPSPVQLVEPTAMALLDQAIPGEPHRTDILSSKEYDTSRHARLARGFYSVTTYTATAVQFVFIPTSIKKVITPVSAVSALICIPAGFTVC